MARRSGALHGSNGEQSIVSDHPVLRYSRQTILPEVGETGQARLRDACVLVVGAGGLGSAVLQYLCAAGVGALVIVDPDRVEESNLHRQPIYRMEDLGLLKAQAAREALLSLNPQVRIEAVCERLTPSNVAHLVAAADLVVDAADSFAATYVASDECHRAGKILVTASVLGLSGYVGAFCGGAPSYRAVFPEMPRQAGSCAQSGVLGTAVGVMGTLQAHTVLALLLDLKPSILGQLVTVIFVLCASEVFHLPPPASRAKRRYRSFRRIRSPSRMLLSTCAAWPKHLHHLSLGPFEWMSLLWSKRKRQQRRVFLQSRVSCSVVAQAFVHGAQRGRCRAGAT
jgi:molybdopterin/thiamine biosynthesis adenylyltransferase